MSNNVGTRERSLLYYTLEYKAIVYLKRIRNMKCTRIGVGRLSKCTQPETSLEFIWAEKFILSTSWCLIEVK